MKANRLSLFDIADRSNLALAYVRARKGKGDRTDVAAFAVSAGTYLDTLGRSLLDGSVGLGDYRYFWINDPKKRLICAAPFRERIVHHAIINIIGPDLDRAQIYDSYACRIGKGTHAALNRVLARAGRYEYFLKLDIRKYYDNIDHDRLKSMLALRFKDQPVQALLYRIIDSYKTNPGKGLPIGNLTSQHFANHYLGAFDHFILDRLRHRAYTRYMDDMILFGHDKAELRRLLAASARFLKDSLGLTLKQAQIGPVSQGVPFLGFRVFPDRIELLRKSRLRFIRKLTGLMEALADGRLTESDFAERSLALCAFTYPARARRFRVGVLEKLGDRPQARTA